MGGCRCSYKNCTNTTKNPENIHFFHYPVKHRERCVQWIENACKPEFYDLEEEQLRNKVVCEMHFEPEWFLNSQKKRLMWGAVPTLDGPCNDPTMSNGSHNGPPIYVPSNQYSDVKVVPANDDGTVFILDTENMFTKSPKIESYIIKNGVLVPTNSNGHARPARAATRFNKPSTSNDSMGYYTGTEADIANINTPPGPSKLTENEGKVPQYPNFMKRESTNPETPPNSYEAKASDSTQDKNTNLQMLNRQKVNKNSKVSKKYLRKIKQHSKEIATIKKMLKQKRLEPQKPDIKVILKTLQPQIPPTLYTVLSLLLGEKEELDDDDIEFFTTIHRLSSETYQLLSETYKWNLPSVDVVDVQSD